MTALKKVSPLDHVLKQTNEGVEGGLANKASTFFQRNTRSILLFGLDFLILCLSFTLACTFYYAMFDNQTFSWSGWFAKFGLEIPALIVFQSGLMFFLGGYDFSSRIFRARRLIRRILGLLLGTIIGTFILVFIFFVQDIHRLVILMEVLIVLPGLPLASDLRTRLAAVIEGRSFFAPSIKNDVDHTSRPAAVEIAAAHQRANRNRVIILGTNERANHLWEKARDLDGQPLKLVGFLGRHQQDGEAGTTALTQEVAEQQIIDTDRPLLDIVRDVGADEIVVALEPIIGAKFESELLECRLHGVSVIDEHSFLEREMGRISIDSPNFAWLIFSPGFQRKGNYYTIKRGMDFLASLVMLTLASPVMLLVAGLVRLDSKGPALFSQTRTGFGNQPFTMYKFRTMREDAEADGVARWAMQNDNRITRLGKYLRQTRLDELPQLINVLKGEMSLVGPRPERPEFVVDLNKKIPLYTERHRVQPGITGWAQTNFSYTSSIDDTRIKLEYDLYYVKNCSLYLDILVLLQTIRVALTGDGAR